MKLGVKDTVEKSERKRKPIWETPFLQSRDGWWVTNWSFSSCSPLSFSYLGTRGTRANYRSLWKQRCENIYQDKQSKFSWSQNKNRSYLRKKECIRVWRKFWYIQIFSDTNIHLYHICIIFWYKYIQIFICIVFIRIFSDIHSYHLCSVSTGVVNEMCQQKWWILMYWLIKLQGEGSGEGDVRVDDRWVGFLHTNLF